MQKSKNTFPAYQKSPVVILLNHQPVPFGNECHYNHNVNGRRHVFTSEEEARRIAHREHRAIIRDLEARLGELVTHITNLRMNGNQGLD